MSLRRIIAGYFNHGRASRAAYAIDWASQWLRDGEALESSTWSYVDAEGAEGGLELSGGDNDLPAATHYQGVATVWAGAASEGVYYLTNRIATNQGRVEERTIQLTTVQR
jgi:hypothetical protein